MEEEKNSGFTKQCMFYGALIGIVLVLFTFTTYITGLSTNRGVGFAQWIILIAAIFFSQKRYRDESLKGYISYGKSLGFGTFTIFFASLITGVFTYLLYAVIDPSLINKILQISEESMVAQGMPDEQIDMALEMTKKFTTPLFMTFSTVFGLTFLGFIFSLITSIFIKKKDNSFDSNFQQ